MLFISRVQKSWCLIARVEICLHSHNETIMWSIYPLINLFIRLLYAIRCMYAELFYTQFVQWVLLNNLYNELFYTIWTLGFFFLTFIMLFFFLYNSCTKMFYANFELNLLHHLRTRMFHPRRAPYNFGYDYVHQHICY